MSAHEEFMELVEFLEDMFHAACVVILAGAGVALVLLGWALLS